MVCSEAASHDVWYMARQNLTDRKSVWQVIVITEVKSLVATGKPEASPSRSLVTSRERNVVSAREDTTFSNERRNYLFENLILRIHYKEAKESSELILPSETGILNSPSVLSCSEGLRCGESRMSHYQLQRISSRVLLSQGCSNKALQTERLKTTVFIFSQF